jgi:hypothetical protein
VLRSRSDNPHRSLLANHPPDVELVWVGGALLYGRESVVQKVKPNQCEALDVNGSKKRICVANTTSIVTKGAQTLAQIRTRLLDKYAQLAPLVR